MINNYISLSFKSSYPNYVDTIRRDVIMKNVAYDYTDLMNIVVSIRKQANKHAPKTKGFPLYKR